MVKFDKIYIKVGDFGKMWLLMGELVDKWYLCVIVYGMVDEINVVFGVVVLYVDGDMLNVFWWIQNDLFDFGVDFVMLDCGKMLEWELLCIVEV